MGGIVPSGDVLELVDWFVRLPFFFPGYISDYICLLVHAS